MNLYKYHSTPEELNGYKDLHTSKILLPMYISYIKSWSEYWPIYGYIEWIEYFFNVDILSFEFAKPQIIQLINDMINYIYENKDLWGKIFQILPKYQWDVYASDGVDTPKIETIIKKLKNEHI